MPLDAKMGRITYMEKGEIEVIADYLKDLEEGLVEWDYRGLSTHCDLKRLCLIITHLMRATYEIEDQELKPLLATLEYKVRRRNQCIEERLAGKN